MSGWTCPECGLAYDPISPHDVVVALRSYPRRYRALFVGFDEDEDADTLLHRRPDATTWSAVEYVAHVGDILDLLADAVHRTVVEDHPHLDFPDPDVVAAARRYNERSSGEVLDWLGIVAERFAAIVEGFSGDQWARTAVFPWGERDALTTARNGVHEGYHHLKDVDRVIRTVRRQH